jgi:nicotinate-nucleotide pyrophosphorylase (carboxylating)
MRDLDGRTLRTLVTGWLAEDVGRGDVTTAAVVPSDTFGRARLEARAPGTVAGLEAAALCFELAAGDVKWISEAEDGDRVSPLMVLARLEGDLRTILIGERAALNIVGRLSGVATLTRSYVDAVAGTTARIVDTRKTTPGLRMLEKRAVVLGGGTNHRFGLDDAILVKDNHIAVAGGVEEAVRRAVAGAPHGMKVEVEVQSLEELEIAIDAGASVVMLDNMAPEDVRTAVSTADGRVLLEASGGITLENVRQYAETGVDLISVGALTHSAPALDVALEIET